MRTIGLLLAALAVALPLFAQNDPEFLAGKAAMQKGDEAENGHEVSQALPMKPIANCTYKMPICIFSDVYLHNVVIDVDRRDQIRPPLDEKAANELTCLRHNLKRVALATDQLSLDDDLSLRPCCDRRGQQHSEREAAQCPPRFPTAGRDGHGVSTTLVSRKTYFVC